MYFSDSISLRAIVSTTNVNGFSVKTPTDTAVFANEKSATRSEFYAANANGINIVKVYEIHVEDWGEQTEVVVETKVYHIERAYQKGLGLIELNCSDKAV